VQPLVGGGVLAVVVWLAASGLAWSARGVRHGVSTYFPPLAGYGAPAPEALMQINTWAVTTAVGHDGLGCPAFFIFHLSL